MHSGVLWVSEVFIRAPRKGFKPIMGGLNHLLVISDQKLAFELQNCMSFKVEIVKIAKRIQKASKNMCIGPKESHNVFRACGGTFG